MSAAIELAITDIAFGGRGVGRHEGKATFVPFTIDGEEVTARLTRAKKHFAEAELEGVVRASEYRVIPPCPYFGRCGGCSYQHISYEHQLLVKAKQVEQLLQRVGRLREVPMQSMIPSPLAYEYRNRITVHAQDGVVGFYRRDAHELMDIVRCPISRDEVNTELSRLRAGRVRDGHYTLRVPGTPRSFAQTNDAVAEKLAELADNFLPADPSLLVDAYCGSGFFAKRLAGKFPRIIGIDWDRFGIAAAREGAGPNETYIAGEVDAELPPILEEADRSRTVVLLDPPATGLTQPTRAALLEFAPATVIYISCNPATLARDVAQLSAVYGVESVTPADMFPQTAEIEVALHLRARAPEKSLAGA